MKKLIFVFIVFALLGISASYASAQQLNNPTGAEFTPSPDHANVTLYEIGWFLNSTVDPVSITEIGKPTPNASNLCVVAINIMPLPFNQYTAKVRAKAGTVYSDWSEPSNIFFRVPGKPGKLDVKK